MYRNVKQLNDYMKIYDQWHTQFQTFFLITLFLCLGKLTLQLYINQRP
jgi:hypothetical protein